MTRIEFGNLKENDVVFDSEGYYIFVGWYNNQVADFKELIYNEEKEDFDVSDNLCRCTYQDLKNAVIL